MHSSHPLTHTCAYGFLVPGCMLGAAAPAVEAPAPEPEPAPEPAPVEEPAPGASTQHCPLLQ
jgi:hypothetical protein